MKKSEVLYAHHSCDVFSEGRETQRRSKMIRAIVESSYCVEDGNFVPNESVESERFDGNMAYITRDFARVSNDLSGNIIFSDRNGTLKR